LFDRRQTVGLVDGTIVLNCLQRVETAAIAARRGHCTDVEVPLEYFGTLSAQCFLELLESRSRYRLMTAGPPAPQLSLAVSERHPLRDINDLVKAAADLLQLEQIVIQRRIVSSGWSHEENVLQMGASRPAGGFTLPATRASSLSAMSLTRIETPSAPNWQPPLHTRVG